MTRSLLVVGVTAILAASSDVSGLGGQTEVRVLCSNGIKQAMETLRASAERAIGHPIALQFGASAVLRRAIEAGDPFDVAILTPQIVGALGRAGGIAAGTAIDVARVNLAAGVRAGMPGTDIGTPDAIRRRLSAARSVTFAKEGAATPAILAMFERLGIASDMERKTVIQTISGRPAESVAEGENEIVLAPVSEILMVRGVALLGLLPPEFQQPIVLTAALGAHARSAGAAQSLIAFLASAEAVASMKASGVDPVVGKK